MNRVKAAMNKREWLIVGGLAALAVLLLLFQHLAYGSQVRHLTVHQDGELVKKLELTPSTDGEIRIPLGEETATVQIRQGRARMLPLPEHLCPHGICSGLGWIEKPGQTIVCVPNRIVVAVHGAQKTESGKPLERQKFFAMDTVFEVQLPREGAGLFETLKEMVLGLERDLKRGGKRSEVAKINAKPLALTSAKERTARLLKRTLTIASQTDGYFDPTLGALNDLWDYREAEVPSRAQVEEALRQTGYEKLRLVKKEQGWRVKWDVSSPENAPLVDLGAIAKGFALEEQLVVLRTAGIKSALLSAGGSNYALGTKPDGSQWRIGIRHPRKEDEILGYVKLKDMALDTSGDYERYFIDDGVRYHHILDPHTGRPARGFISVTVVCESPVRADALATALFAMGPERAISFLKRNEDLHVLLVTEDMQLIASPHMSDIFHPKSGLDVIELAEYGS